MDLGLSGKKALVCGASRGIGRAIAEGLAQEGVELVLCARQDTNLVRAADEIRQKTGARIHFRTCNLAEPEDRNELIEAVKEFVGDVDILVHNTGGPRPSSVQDTSLDDWENGFNQLFEMVVHLNQAFLPKMKEKKWGRILCVTSLSVLEPISNLAVSNAMRSAVTSMLKTLADEIAHLNITVNCLAPGSIKTERLENLMEARIAKTGQSKEAYLKQYISGIPMGRLGTPEEFAAVAVFLASQKASYVTGSTIAIDGGKRKSTF